MYIKLTAANSPYNLGANPALSNTSDRIIEDIYIECDSTAGPITINLPNVSALPQLNTKVYVNDASGTAQTNNITVTAGSTNHDLINGVADGSVVIAQNKGSVKLETVQKTSTTGGWLSIAGSANNTALKRVKITATEAVVYNADGSEDIIACYPTLSTINVVLATANRAIRRVTVKDEGSTATAHNITVTPHAGDTLDGAGAQVITVNKGFIELYNAGPGLDATKNFTLDEVLA